MLKMVDGTGIIGVDMICPLGVSTPQPPNYDRVELEGTGMLVLPNSLDAPLERLELSGKTEQVQTTGKNVWDPNAYADFGLNENSANSIRFENDVVTYISDKGSYNQIALRIPIGKLQIGDYKVSFGRVTCKRKDTSKTESGTLGAFAFYKDGVLVTRSVTFSVDDPNADYSMTCSGFSAGNNGLLELSVENPMISQISVGTYEPYTGGKPSPSPEYPQEIKNVGKWNEETQKYEIDVKVTGRNLFNGKLSKGKFITDDMNVVSDLATMNTFDKPVEIEPNTDYVISANGVIWEGNINVYDENGKKIVQHFTGKFKTPSNAKYIRASISNARAPIDSKIQMEYGTAMNEFEQYHQPQVLTLTSDRPITKWDKLVEQGGEIGWLYKSKIIDGFDGQSSNITLGGKQGKVQHFSVVFADTPNGNGNGDIYVDRYRAIAMSYTKAEFGICCNWNSGVKFFSAPNENVTTVQEFKTWLAENPLVLVYETTSTEFIPLPQPEQNAIRALKTYYPTTVITADGGELDPDIKVTYRKEI